MPSCRENFDACASTAVTNPFRLTASKCCRLDGANPRKRGHCAHTLVTTADATSIAAAAATEDAQQHSQLSWLHADRGCPANAQFLVANGWKVVEQASYARMAAETGRPAEAFTLHTAAGSFHDEQTPFVVAVLA